MMTGPLVFSFFCVLFGCLGLAEETVDIAAFNIRRFGIAKTDDSAVMNIIVKIILRYDLVVIQEITDKSGKAINTLLKEVNRNSPEGSYELEISSRLGRSAQKEQYGFLYRSDKFQVEESYVFDDNEVDLYEREPFVVRWKTNSGMLFTTIAIHTKPTDALAELKDLHNVAEDAMQDTQNVILMGDFNADCDYVRKKDWNDIPLWTNSKYVWLIGSDEDTTSTPSVCAYDRMVITKDLEKYLTTDNAEIFRYDKEYQLNPEQTLAVSDHYPVSISLKFSSKRNRRSNRGISRWKSAAGFN